MSQSSPMASRLHCHVAFLGAHGVHGENYSLDPERGEGVEHQEASHLPAYLP